MLRYIVLLQSYDVITFFRFDYFSASILMSGAETAEKSSPEADQGDHSRSQGLLKKLRNRFWVLASASFVVSLVTLGLIWHFDPWSDQTLETAPPLPPDQRFAQQLEAIVQQDLDDLHISDYQVTDDMVAKIADLKQLDTVIFDLGLITDRGVETITTLPKLNHLRLRLSPITDSGLEKLSNCQSLWYLNLPHADCTSDGIAHLKKLKNLRQLRLGSKQLGNEVTDQIAQLTGLRGVHLIGVPVTDEGLETLAAMPYLESLYLDDAAVTEAGWERLFRNHPDLHVHVNQRHHDRDPKAHRHHD